MMYLDRHNDVVQWSSEEFSIPYKSPLDGKIHRYFPDFWVKQRDKNGNTVVVVIEVKPHVQTIEPVPKKKKSKTYLREVKTWAVNQAKWKAADSYCKDRAWKFQIMNEYNLGIQK